jgi:PhnB protein
MTKVYPYITFNGTCEEAFNLYKSVFGGEFQYLGRFKDVPATDSATFQGDNDNKIMHISLLINDTMLMGCDNPDANAAVVNGNNISLTINLNDKAEAERLFKGLSKGGEIKMPLESTFWGAYFGILTDRFGIQWLINCENQ